MNLLNPTPAELVDRITILFLKIQYGIARRRPIVHFLEELTQLVLNLPPTEGPGDVTVKWWNKLAESNRIIWELEDRCRDDPKLPHVLIQAANDARYQAIKELNPCFGCMPLGDEKVNP